MATHTFAKYTIINKGDNFTLKLPGAGNTKTLSFPLPDTAFFGYWSILAFRVYPTASNTNVQFNVYLNDKSVFKATLTFAGTSFRTVHEVLDPNILKGNNKLQFTVTSGTVGTVEVSDVVLLWMEAIEL